MTASVQMRTQEFRPAFRVMTQPLCFHEENAIFRSSIRLGSNIADGRGVLMVNPNDVYVRIWEFQAQPGKEDEFERIYGPDGEWVDLFRKSEYFLRTDLYRDIETDGRYVTVDYFASQPGFQAFLREFREEYDALDRRCEAVCASEKRMGSFSSVGQLKLR